jgi:hypothetical protein
VDRGGVVPIPFDMTSHNRFETIPFKVWARDCTGIQQHLLYILGKRIPVPDPEVFELVAAEEEPLKSERCDQVIDLRHPLRHAIVVRILCFERKLEKFAGEFTGQASVVPCKTAISPELKQTRISFSNQAQANVIVDTG